MDIQINDQGSIVLMRPVTIAASEWIADHISDDALWFGAALAVEWRYADNIIDGMICDGLDVAA